MTSKLFVFFLLVVSNAACAGWLDSAKEKVSDVKNELKQKETKHLSSPLDNKKITQGLKAALSKGADYAVDSLGKTNGFLKNQNVRIPMPAKLSKVEKILRKTGQDKYADEFIETMNHAAEQAVPLTLNVLKTAITTISIEQAENILKGPDNAATQYLRKTGGNQLYSGISPIVKKATEKTGVTRQYKNLYNQLGFMNKYMKPEDYDIDDYITQKTLDGLFYMIQVEEKKIRDNPLERTSDILKTVFGSLD